ncbi:MAG: DUF695 domain-containing protein [Campylobacterota bacterium]|nr:DUF695 domain-containing protein [Campylobacterota bacterium]
MNQDNWYLKETKNLNRLLKISQDEGMNKDAFPQLLTITHQYTTRDDVMFPEISTLAFFSGFEEGVLTKLETQKKVIYVINDVDHGIFSFYIYTQDAQQTVKDCIEYFKRDGDKKIDFHIQNDPKWDIYEQFKNL